MLPFVRSCLCSDTPFAPLMCCRFARLWVPCFSCGLFEVESVVVPAVAASCANITDDIEAVSTIADTSVINLFIVLASEISQG